MIEQLLILEVCRLIAAPIARAMHDPLKIFRAAEILSDAIVFAGLTALATSVVASICCIVVTCKFTAYLKRLDAKKLGLALLCLMPLGLSGCWGGDDEDDCYWWHRHRHPHHWRTENSKADAALLGPVKFAAMPTTDEPAKPEIVAKPGPFGGITVMQELRELKEHVAKLANRPVVCLCECGRRQRGPSIYWRVDPLNPSVIQYGYEVGGFFYVLSSSPRPVGFEPPK